MSRFFRWVHSACHPILLAVGLLGVAAATSVAQTPTVPAILPVASRAVLQTVTGASYSCLSCNGAKSARDSAGNVYVFDAGKPQVIEVPVSGPVQIVIPSTDNAATTVGAYNGQMAVDPAGNIYLATKYGATITKVTRNTNGTYNLGAANETDVHSNVFSSANGYYTQFRSDFTVDALGNLYIIENDGNQQGIVAGGPTIGSAKYIYGNNTNSPAISAIPQAVAVDGSGNVFFVDGVSVHEITAAQVAASTSTTPAVPSVIGNGSCTGCTALAGPASISIDLLGNLLVGQSTTSRVSILPLNSLTTTGFSSSTPIYLLPPTISGNTTAGGFVVTNNQGDYLAINSQSGVQTINLYGSGSYEAAPASSNTLAGTVALGSSDSNTALTPTVGYLFTQATTLTSPFYGVLAAGAPYGGVSSSYPQFKPSATTCVASQAVGSLCSTTVAYSPKFPGVATGSVVLYGAGGAVVNQTAVEALFTGSIANLDTGVKTAIGSGLSTPAAVSYDASGTMYVADPGAGAVYSYAAGANSSTAGTSVVTSFANGVSPASLSTPYGVAVDSSGDVFIADTGNNRVLYLPFVSGGTLGAARVVSISGYTLNAPKGVAFDGLGKLYIADTGNGRILRMANPMGTSVTTPQLVGGYMTGTTYNSPFTTPYAMAFDAFNDLFVADAGSASIIEVQGGEGFYSTATGNFGSGNGTTTATTVGSGLNNPTGIAVDGSGAIYVADGGNARIVKFAYTSSGYASSPTVLFNATGSGTNLNAASAGGLARPFGLAIDVSGDLYFTDATQAGLYFAQRSQPSGSTTINIALPLPNAASGSTSTATAVLTNNGYGSTMTETVGTLASPYSITTNGCANATLAAGASCADVVTFTGPSTTDANNAGALTFTTNEQGSTGSPTTVATLSGVSTSVVVKVTITGLTTVAYGATATYTVKATDSGGYASASANGTQTVNITGCGSFSPTVTLTGGVGSFLLPSVSVGSCTLSSTISGINGTLAVMVTKGTLTVTAANASRIFDTVNPTFSYSVTGYANGDNGSVLSGVATYTTSAVRSSPAGTYSLTPSGTLTATNYNVVYAAGTLTVTGSAPQAILFNYLPSFTGGTTVTLTGLSSSGLPLSYTTSAGTISGYVLTVPAKGTNVTVTATQAGNASYAAATSVARSFTAQ
jgi:sugar lactone lactonase YvrE